MRSVNIEAVAEHYSQEELLSAIHNGLTALGKTIDTVSIDDLAPVDEFHIGGRPATRALLDQLDLSSDKTVLDIGCGLGGTSRFIAATYESRVKGIDLTPAYVKTGSELCKWVGLEDRVELKQGNALQTGFDDASFDAACMLHVGMNIPDKHKLFAEINRVLRPGGQIAIYDIMRASDEPLAYPVPWASVVDTCVMSSPEHYRHALEVSGFEIVNVRDRTEFATDFFEMLKKNAAARGGPPPIGLHLVMGKATPDKVANMIKNVTTGKAAPTEMIARKV